MTSTLEAARAAAGRHAWSETLEILRAEDSTRPLAGAELELLGRAAWWMGDINSCIDARERAYVAYVEEGNMARAGVVCLNLAEDHFHRLAESVGRGWLTNAERILGALPETVEYGWLARMQSVVAIEGRGDVEAALQRSRVAHELGVRFGDPNLEVLSIHDQGRALLAGGRVEEGLALMEQAAARAVSGELEAMATGKIYCNMIDACERLADYRRAKEWDEEARRWCERVGQESGFPGICRVKRAEIMMMSGTWSLAEAEARKATVELVDFLDFAGHGFSEIGAIRLRMGDHAGAEEAFRQARELGLEPQPGLALLRLATGDVATARQLIDRRLEDAQLRLDRARLLPARIEIALAADDLETAEQDAAELDAIAEEFKSETLSAAAAHYAGMTALHQGNHERGIEMLRLSGKLYTRCGLPYEAARSRLGLGLAYRARGADELARLEIDAARSAFEQLGAEPEARRATQLLLDDDAPDPGVRKIKAMMFTDLVSSTSLVEAIGDEAWTHLVRWHDRMLRSLFEKFGGIENDRAGDGFFVVFASSRDAIDCAIEIQRSLQRHRADSGFAPEVRIGIHSAEITEVAGTHTGVEVHKAARIAGLAAAGEVVATADTLADLPDLAGSRRRSVDVRGISEPVEVATVVWE
ncbi:MAG: hypothetical protein KY394_04585 [Actinobacteria bacterium]|nr:hypothetical protein [Actinomycetota bacterium]